MFLKLKFLFFFLIFFLFIIILNILLNNTNYHLKYFNFSNKTVIKFNKNNLILSLALNYNFTQIENFIFSLNKSHYKGKVILFTYTISQVYEQLLSFYNVNVIELNFTYPFYPFNHTLYPISESNVLKCLYYYKGKSFVTYRYFIYKLFIKYYGKYYNHILITDIRDVLFQKNPFQWNIERGIYLIEEHPTRNIGSDKSNIMFVEKYKPSKLIYKSTIINGGIIYGSYPEISFFLSDFLKYICSFHCNGNDQGGINTFIRVTKCFSYPLFVLNSSHTPVKTLALWLFDSPKCCLPINNIILNIDLSTPHIIHQYDRAIKVNYYNNYTIKLYKSYINYYII